MNSRPRTTAGWLRIPLDPSNCSLAAGERADISIIMKLFRQVTFLPQVAALERLRINA